MVDAVSQTEEVDPDTANVVIEELSIGGQDTELENKNEDDLNTDGIPNKVSDDAEVFSIRNNNSLNNENNNGDSPPKFKNSKQINVKTKKNKKNGNWNTKGLSLFQQMTKIKRHKLACLRIQNSRFTMWTSFRK